MSFETPDTLADFFDRLAAGVFPGPTPDHFERLRHLTEARFSAGEVEFGDAYLERENLREAEEEEADAIVYRYLAVLRHIAKGGDYEDLALALEASRKSYEAWLCDRQLEAKWRGCP